jgi:hypothetical protein
MAGIIALFPNLTINQIDREIRKTKDEIFINNAPTMPFRDPTFKSINIKVVVNINNETTQVTSHRCRREINQINNLDFFCAAFSSFFSALGLIGGSNMKATKEIAQKTTSKRYQLFCGTWTRFKRHIKPEKTKMTILRTKWTVLSFFVPKI